MAEIYNFNNSNNEEECECTSCQLAHKFIEIVRDVENDEELFDVLRDLISVAGDFRLADYLQEEISANARLLDYIVYGECDEHE
jgi:hypothetical protein